MSKGPVPSPFPRTWYIRFSLFGRNVLIRRHKTNPPIFSERHVREIKSFRLFGLRFTIRPPAGTMTSHLDKPRYTK